MQVFSNRYTFNVRSQNHLLIPYTAKQETNLSISREISRPLPVHFYRRYERYDSHLLRPFRDPYLLQDCMQVLLELLVKEKHRLLTC